MGVALGNIGLSLDDFERLSDLEWEAVVSGWELLHRDRWERTRRAAAFSFLPHAKRGTDFMKVMPLPWDGEGDDFPVNGKHRTGYLDDRRRLGTVSDEYRQSGTVDGGSGGMTKEAHRKRAEELAGIWGFRF